MKENIETTDEPMSFLRDWRFYVLSYATCISAIIVLCNIIFGVSSVVGLMVWLILTVCFYTVGSSIATGKRKIPTNLFILSIIGAILVSLAGIYMTLLIFTNIQL